MHTKAPPDVAMCRPMRITFLLPKYFTAPIGGFKVPLEYANRLVARGHECTVVMPVFGCAHPGAQRIGRSAIKFGLQELIAGRGQIAWMDVDPKVRLRTPVHGRPWSMPRGDVIVATSWRTASVAASCGRRAGIGTYLVQHYETWDCPAHPELIDNTWRLPLYKMVISQWLYDKAVAFGEADRTSYTPNGIDLDALNCFAPIDSRPNNRIGMLVHPAAWKGTDIGLRALEIAQAEVGDLDVELYGASAAELAVPSWMTMRGQLHDHELPDYFNSLALFVHPSLTEGWGLPPAEAMACGVAVVAADNHGVLDYARDEENALVVPRGSAQALADAIIRLVRSSHERERLAKAGVQTMQAYGLDSAADRFERALLRSLAPEFRSNGSCNPESS